MDKKQIGTILRTLRGNKPREEIALAIGVTSQAIVNYESGPRIPTDDIKVKIAEFYGKTVQEIFYAS